MTAASPPARHSPRAVARPMATSAIPSASPYSRANANSPRSGLGYFGPGAGGVGPEGGFLPYGSSEDCGRGNLLEAARLRRRSTRCSPPTGTEPGAVSASDGFGINADGSVFSLGNEQPGSVANFRGDQDPRFFTDRIYTYNFAPWLLPADAARARIGLRARVLRAWAGCRDLRPGAVCRLHGRYRDRAHSAVPAVHPSDQSIHPGGSHESCSSRARIPRRTS